jgi:hypothetical protein
MATIIDNTNLDFPQVYVHTILFSQSQYMLHIFKFLTPKNSFAC